MNQNFEKIKIALLGIIAVTLVIQTVFTAQSAKENYAVTQSVNTPSELESELNAPIPATNNVNNTPAEAPVPAGPPTTIKFTETEHNFGKVMQESENKKSFKFTNTGKEPLVIQNAVGSCGCTVPTFPKEPIAPGKTGTIEVVYKPGQQKGSQQKTVTITANTEPMTTMLFISADVQEKK